jgi:hypothetical protein
MATIPYVTSAGKPWWSAARLNSLFAEFDRRLSLALAGKTPYLLARYPFTPFLPLAAGYCQLPIGYAGSPHPAGIQATTGLLGTVYGFTGPDAPHVYFAYTTPWDQAALATAADTCTEISRDEAALTMLVDDSALTSNLETSLQAFTRTDPDTEVAYWLVSSTAPGVGMPGRAMRQHRYAVAELVCEGLATFTVPRTWDRYGCFRIHNLSAVDLTLTVETYEADGATPGADQTIAVPKFGCRSFRREPGYYDAAWNYFWQARAGLDKRFFKALGIGLPESSAEASNIAHPNILRLWLQVLEAEPDPWIDPPDERPRYGALFGDPTTPTTIVHDLLVHTGTVQSVGWDAAQLPVKRSGTLHGWATLVDDLAPLGIVATIAGPTVTLSRSTASPPNDAPGVPANGLDVFCPGTNLLWAQDGSVSIPGQAPVDVPVRQRQYSVLPLTLITSVPITPDPIGTAVTGYVANAPYTATVDATIYGDTGTSEPLPYDDGTAFPGSGTVARNVAVSAAGTAFTGIYSNVTEWRLTPAGFAARLHYQRTLTASADGERYGPADPTTGQSGIGSIYDRWTGLNVERVSWLALAPPGWTPNSISPLQARAFGRQQIQPAAGGAWWTEDWANLASDPDGQEPTATGKVLVDYPELKYLSDAAGQLVGDAYIQDPGGGGLDDVLFTRYEVLFDNDEARGAMDHLDWAHRISFTSGTPYNPGGALTEVFYLRRAMQIEDFNSLAWAVNSWTRTKPLMTLALLWLKREANEPYGLVFPEGQAGLDWLPTIGAYRFTELEYGPDWRRSEWATVLPVKLESNWPDYPGAPVTGGDPGYFWVTTADVTALATAKGLPWFVCRAGGARKIVSWQWPLGEPDGFMQWVAAEASSDTHHIDPSESQDWNHGIPTIHPCAVGPPDDVLLGTSKHLASFAAIISVVNYPGFQPNTRLLHFPGFGRYLLDFYCDTLDSPNGTNWVGGAFFTDHSTQSTICDLGLTYAALPPGTAGLTQIASHPYIDLAG